MKRFILIAMAATLSVAAFAQQNARWIRKSAISPDGNTIAFSWQGDIWTVSSKGGAAHQITSNPAYDSDPMWTVDGKSIVFSSYRELSKDIWVVPATGGVPARITDYPGAETPLAVTADGMVIFGAAIQQDASYGDFPGSQQVWTVPLSGGKPEMLVSMPMAALSVNADGNVIYEDIKGYEDPLRKHHTSSVTRDIWEYVPASGSFTKLSSFAGEDRNPVFAADGSSYWYISEADGNLNIWKSSLQNPADAKQVTFLKTHPVRFMSASGNGTLLFSWNGDLYTLAPSATEPVKLDITVTGDNLDRDMIRQKADSHIGGLAVSPNGKEIAVVSRGDVYVTNTEAESTRRITNTPSQERGVSFSADGRTLYYAAERDGEWAIWSTSLVNKADKYFSLACDFKEERFTKPGQTCFQPVVSPDGKWVAYLRDRTDIVIKNVRNGEEKVLLQGVNYSYTDGDQSFEWSPDSRSILTEYIGNGGWNNSDIALIDIESGSITDLTQSGYSDGGFNWALGGKAMVWSSDKAGYRSHGSWGATRDLYMMFFDGKAYYEFVRGKNEGDIEKLLAGDDKKGKGGKPEAKDGAKDSTKTAKTKAVKLDLAGREDRIVRITRSSGYYGGGFTSPDGKLYYTSGGELISYDLNSHETKTVKKGVGGAMFPDKDVKNIYTVGGNGVQKISLPSGATKPVKFSGEFEYRPAAEREYIFEHCWKQVDEKFYDAQIHGLDWKLMHDNYVQFLPYINNNYDFQDLLSEMLGELNGSHTGARYRPRIQGAPNAGHIGVLYDLSYTGKGLKIAEVLPGSMLGNADPEIKAGDVILSVDGKEIKAGDNWYDAFAWTSGKRVELVVSKNGKKETLHLTPNGSDSNLLYTRWVRQREKMVEELSGGRIGYVHVKGMDSDSFREVYSKALGKYRGCDALIVDTRHNGGGWLHDDLCTFLSGKAYIEFRPRGQYIGTEPYSKWTKPSCVLIGEDNYSDACGFPYSYKALGIGKLIGAPVPGTMTAVWWETQVDNTMIFGIPQVTSWGLKENRPIENLQIEPDILIYNDPASVLKGEDKQLEAAVKEMLQEVDRKKAEK